MNPRETIMVIVAVMMTVLSSCETVTTERYGIDLPVSPGATGASTIEVDFTVSAISLTGSISATEGSIMAEVMSPSGAVVFSVTAGSPGEIIIDRSFPVEEGVWRLHYLSLNGKGHLSMHLELTR